MVSCARRLQPEIQREDGEIQRIVEAIERWRKNMKANGQSFQEQIIENEVSMILLEMTNIVLKRMDKVPNYEQSHREEIANKLINLLIFY